MVYKNNIYIYIMNDSNIKKIMRNIAIENSKLDEQGNRFGYKKKVSNVSLMSEENFNKMLGFKIDRYSDVSATEKQPVEVVTTDVSNFFKLNDIISKDTFINIQKSNNDKLKLLLNSINERKIQTNSSNLNVLKSTINDTMMKNNIINQSNQNNIQAHMLLKRLKNKNKSKNLLKGDEMSTNKIYMFSGIPGEYNINTPNGTPLNYNNSVWTSDISSDTIPDNIRRMGSSYVMTRVRNQGTCGSCWAFSLITACEIAWFLAGGEKQALSVQSILDCDYYHFTGGTGSGSQSINVANPRKAVGPFDSSYSELMDMVTSVNYNRNNQNKRCRGQWTSNAVMSLLHRDPDGGIPSEEDYPYIERGRWNEDIESSMTDHAVHTCKTNNSNSTAIKPTCFVNSIEYCENGESDSGLYDLLQTHGHVCVNIHVSRDWSNDYGGGIIDIFQEAQKYAMIREQGRPYVDLNKYRDYLISSQNHAVTLVGCGEVTSDYYNKGNRNDEHEQQFPIGTKYWIIRNSWDEDWGEPYDGGVIGGGGYFRVKRYSSNERLTSDNISAPSSLFLSGSPKQEIGRSSDRDHKFQQDLYDYIGIIGPMSINLLACSITVRKSLIPYAPSSQSIRGCTDIGQLCEFSYDSADPYNYIIGLCRRDNTNPNKLKCYSDVQDRNIEGFSVGGLKDCPKGNDNPVTACNLHYSNCDKLYSHNWTDGKYHTCRKGGLADLYRCIPSEPCGADTYHLPPVDANFDDYKDGLTRPSGLVNYETLKCHTKDDQGNWIENDNIGGSACTTHNCINDNKGLLNEFSRRTSTDSLFLYTIGNKFRGHNPLVNGNICNYLDCDEIDDRLPGEIDIVSYSEYYCPEKCLQKQYRLNDDGTVVNDDIYICPNKKRNTPSAYEPCSTAEYTDPDFKGNCSPLDGINIDNNPSIITYGGHTGLSKRTE
jgi:C1A family cysteine protease